MFRNINHEGMSSAELFSIGEDGTTLTYTGRINVFKAEPSDFNIYDIGHALSYHAIRWLGPSRVRYSVAQHSCMAFDMADYEDKLQALLHDAAEAYLPDLPSPIKRFMPEFQALEDELLAKIAKRFGFGEVLSPSVHEIDKTLAAIEFENLIVKGTFEVWSADRSFNEFLQRYDLITGTIPYDKTL